VGQRFSWEAGGIVEGFFVLGQIHIFSWMKVLLSLVLEVDLGRELLRERDRAPNLNIPIHRLESEYSFHRLRGRAVALIE